MQLHTLPKTTTTRKRRIGRGHGSGRGKTATRGTKGQKARRTIQLHFEGGALPLIKRLPFRRGKGKNKIFKKHPIVVNVKALNLLPADTTVTVEALVKHNIIDESEAKLYGVKILGEGELSLPLMVALPVSRGARQKIESAGGKIV